MVTPSSTVQLDPETLLVRLRQLESQLKLSEARCARAEYKLQDLLRRIHGPKSEKISSAQWALFGLPEAAEAALARAAAKTAGTTSTKQKKRGGRRAAPQDLPVHREVIDLPEEQRAGLVKIREEITEQIEYRPSLFFRRQIIRPVYASRERAHAPIVAALPAQVIPQAGVGPGFLTHVVISKYLDHIPLHRQERIDARGGVWITRQARCRYVEHVAYLLITIHQYLKRKILDSGYVQLDETFTKLLDRDRGGKARDAYLWVTMPHTNKRSCWSSRPRAAARSCIGSSRGLAWSGPDRWSEDVSGRLPTLPRCRAVRVHRTSAPLCAGGGQST